MQKNKNDIIKYYQKLPANMKIIIQLLAIQIYELTQKDILSCLFHLKINDDNMMPFTQKTIRLQINKLEALKLIIRKPKGIICVEPVQSDALLETVKENQFEKIASVLLKVNPFRHPYQDISIKGHYREVLISVYSDNKLIDIDAVYNSGKTNFFQQYQINSPFLKFFNSPFNPDLFDSLSLSTRIKTLRYLITDAEKKLEPSIDAFNYYLSILSDGFDEMDRYKVMEFLLFRGRIKEHQKYMAGFEDSTSSLYAAHMACAQMLVNDNDKALINFNKALSLLKKKTGKRKIFLRGYYGLFFLFALIKSNNSKDHKSALEYIDIAVKNTSRDFFAMGVMKAVFQEKLGVPVAWNNSFNLSDMQNSLVDYFLNILVLSMIDQESIAKFIPDLKEIRDKAFISGHLWIEAEINALLVLVGHNAPINKKRSKDIHKKCGTTTLVGIVKSVPKWEKNLRSLINIGEASTTTSDYESPVKVAGQERIIWLLQYTDKYYYCHIIPRIQKLSKNGTWTKGRAVALKNLYNNYHTMDCLTDQDRQVCSTITEESYRSGYSYYYNVEYDFDDNRALPALVGHPYIFLEDSLESPVELVTGGPEVRLRMESGKINIIMNPMPPENENQVLIVMETPSRFKLVRFSFEQLKIAEILGEGGLKMPDKAKQMASKAVTSLSSYITVQSDLAASGDESVKEVNADFLPHVHVMPWQEGVKVEFFVRPFTDTGSYFKPGRGGSNVYAEVDGVKVQAERNLKREKKSAQAVIDKCPTLELLEEVEGQWLVDGTDDALELLLELKNCGDDLVLKWPQGEKMKIRSQVSSDSFRLDIKKERDWFKATGTLNIDDALSIDLSKLMELLEKPSGRFITMDDGTFLAITNSFKERLEELRAYSTPCKNGVLFTPLAAPAIEELTENVGSLKSDKAWKDHCKKLKEIIKPAIPGTLQAKLRDYQITGFKWLSQLSHWKTGACLADDMGLGKTVQALAAILPCAGDGPTLVIAPLSVMNNWQEECNQFAPTLNPVVFGQGDRQKFLDELAPFDLVISSYGLLQVEGEKLAGVDWQTIVLDEAQAIKNMRTKRSKAAMKLNSRFKIITTGTPVENHLSELWTLFNFLNPGLLGTFQHFKNTFATPIERDQNKKASRRLKKLIQPFILRRLKTDVLKELPAKTEVTLHIEMSHDEAVLYEAQRLKSIEKIENADGKPGQKHLQILAELTKLRQLCCNPALVLPGTGIESSKLKVFGDMVDDLLNNNHKVLVFSQFVRHLTILREFLDKKKITYQYLDGSTPVKKRKERIKAFQSGIGDIFLISLKAGGFGLNLTAADYIIHMDPWWNPAVEDQASDRAHRIGQTRPVTVYRMVVKDSIEQQIINLHKEKRELAQNLLSGSDISGKMSAEDLLSLLRGNIKEEQE